MRVFLHAYDEEDHSCIYYNDKNTNKRKYKLSPAEDAPEIKYIKYQACDAHCKVCWKR